MLKFEFLLRQIELNVVSKFQRKIPPNKKEIAIFRDFFYVVRTIYKDWRPSWKMAEKKLGQKGSDK